MPDKLAYEYVLEALDAVERDSRMPGVPIGADTVAARFRFAIETLAVIVPFWGIAWSSVSWARVELSHRPERFGSLAYLWPDLSVLLLALPLWCYAVIVDRRACAIHREHRLGLLVSPLRRLLLLYLGYSAAVFLVVDAHRVAPAAAYFVTHGFELAVGLPLIAVGFYSPYWRAEGEEARPYSGYRTLSSEEAAAISRDACVEHVRAHREDRP